MIWLNRVAMIFSYVMLDIRSILFLKTQKYNKVPRWYEIPNQSHMLFSLQNLPHMQLAISLSIVKLLWPLVRFISYSYDQNHIHMLCFYTRSKQTFIHPQNKTPCLCMISLAQKHIKDMLLCKKKENKRCIPK